MHVENYLVMRPTKNRHHQVNVRKNRERRYIDILKLAAIITNEKGTSGEIAKKHGFPNGSGDVRVRELRQIHKKRDLILDYMRTRNIRSALSLYKVKEILEELRCEKHIHAFQLNKNV